MSEVPCTSEHDKVYAAHTIASGRGQRPGSGFVYAVLAEANQHLSG